MLEIIVLTIFIATIVNLILTRFHIPTIIGYITTGVIISLALQLSEDTHPEELHIIAEFGIVFLMFTIGLEFSVQHFMRMKKKVFIFGGLQVGLSMIAFFLLTFYVFDIDVKSSIIISTALSLSSTAIVLKILNSNREITKEYGRRSLGILIFQDIMVIPILLMITIFSMGETLSLGTLALKITVDAILLFVILWVFGKFILEPFFNEVIKSNSDEIFIGSILFLVMGASVLAHNLGFSYSLGAFVAGMIIAETRYKNQIEADLIPFRDLLLGIFFITVGMQINFAVIAEHYLTILGLLLLFTLVKMSIIYLILRPVTSKSVAIKTSLALFQLGEFGLVVFELANSKELLDPTVSQVLIVTTILSMILTPFVLRHISTFANALLPQKDEEEDVDERQDLHNHVVVLGYGRLGRRICETLEHQAQRYIAIENNIANVKEGQKEGKSVLFGNAAQKSILASVNIAESAAVLIAFDNSTKLHLVCDIIQQMSLRVPIIIKVNKFQEKEDLEKEFPNYKIVVGTEQVAKGMIESMAQCNMQES